jgi:hypothetical protein
MMNLLSVVMDSFSLHSPRQSSALHTCLWYAYDELAKGCDDSFGLQFPKQGVSGVHYHVQNAIVAIP